MKVVLFYDQGRAHSVAAICEVLCAQGCAVTPHAIEQGWNDTSPCSTPLALVQDATHVFFLYAHEPMRDPAFIFFSGVACGRGMHVLLLATTTEVRDIHVFRDLVFLLEEETFEDFFRVEHERFVRQKKKRVARTALLERGYPCFEENFIATVMDGNIDIVNLFLDAGFSAALKDARGTPVLSLAVREGQDEMAAQLIARGAPVDQLSDDRAYSALMEAAQIGNRTVARLLLHAGADPNVRGSNGQTALVLAVGRKDHVLIRLLMDHGANPYLEDKLGLSAQGYAKLFNDPTLCTLVGV